MARPKKTDQASLKIQEAEARLLNAKAEVVEGVVQLLRECRDVLNNPVKLQELVKSLQQS